VARRFRVALATEADRRTIYGVRHEVYARELGQHLENAERSLHDALDDGNVYVVARLGVAVVGFVSLTPPGHGAYSLDKYLRRDEMPFPLDAGTWEIRILTVVPEHRGTVAAALLMYAAFRWVEAHGGSRVIALGRREVRGMYGEAGLTPCGRELRAGEVDYVPMTARPAEIRQRLARFDRLLRRLEGAADWRLVVPFLPPAPCFHGGAFFDAIGDGFDALHRRTSVINADVLDAWFPPSPRVMAALEEHLPWLLRTSPPTGCAGMVRAIARARGVPPSAVLPGAGSSSLIYLALPKWLRPSSRVVLPEPAYGEYAHVLDHVVRCHVERHVLARPGGYALDLPLLERALAGGPDLLVLVNPNSPTGRHEPRRELESFLRRVPAGTLVWVDETYVDYADPGALPGVGFVRPRRRHHGGEPGEPRGPGRGQGRGDQPTDDRDPGRRPRPAWGSDGRRGGGGPSRPGRGGASGGAALTRLRAARRGGFSRRAVRRRPSRTSRRRRARRRPRRPCAACAPGAAAASPGAWPSWPSLSGA
jgi:GNAT superfamily N-acetyltransferase